MQISIRPDLEQYLEEQVKTGHYPSRDAVVEEALVRLRDEQPGWTIESLRRELDLGLGQLEQGEDIQLNNDQELDAFFESIKRAGRERLIRNATNR